MIISSQNIFPIATQKNLSFNINLTPKDLSLSTISFKENKDFTFTLQSGKFSDINNKSVYFYNTGENINLSGNIHHLQQNNFSQWSGSEKFLYDYYINGNPIILSGTRTGLMGNNPTGYSKISGLTFSGSNLELTNFQVFGISPVVNLQLAPTFTFGQLITGFLNYENTLQESCRILSGSVSFPTGFNINSLPSGLTGLGIASGGFNINTNFNPQYSDIPLRYNVTLNLLTDFGLLSKSFITSGLPSSYIDFFVNVNGAYFNLFNIPSGVTYNIESFFFSGGNEYAKSITIEFNYAAGGTGLQQDSATFYGSGTRNFNLDIVVTGTGIFTLTGTGFASGFFDGSIIFGTGNLSGSFQTGITGGNFQRNVMITGSGISNFSHFNLTNFTISGYRTGIFSSGTIVRSGTVTGYISPFSGSGTATFYNNSRFILNSTVPLGILRDTRVFTGVMNYPIAITGTTRITGFNSTFLDYSGNSAGQSLTGLLVGSGFIYSAPTNFTTTGILRSEVNNRRITGILNTQIVDFVFNTGINLARVVTIVSGEATGNFLNNPDIFGLSTLGTGQNIVTGRNTIFGQGFITGINTGYIIKDNFITTGIVTGIFLYSATGNPNNIGDPVNRVVSFYNAIVSGNANRTGINLLENILFTGAITSAVRFTGLIVQQGNLYSDPINFTGLNTIIYNSISGGLKTGRFVKIFNNTILEQNTFFTGSGSFSNNVFSTGLSSGINWTYFTVSGSGFSNRIFTGVISNGSGDVYHVSTASAFNTSGIASGQIGNFVLAGPRFSAGTYVSTLANEFFTGNKIEFRQIIVSGVATGTKYNYQGLTVDYSGYPLNSGSGFFTGSGFILLTGRGVLTGTDGSTGFFSTTGNNLILLTGNPALISDPVNIFYKYYDNVLSTGSGFYRIENFGREFPITGATSPLVLTGQAFIFQGDYIGNLISNSTGFRIASGTNFASFTSRTLFSGITSNPSFTGDFFYFTGISNQVFAGIVSGVMTGINDNPVTGAIAVINSNVSITGFIIDTEFGSGALEKYVSNVIISGYAIDDIRNSLQRYTNQSAYITGLATATGIYRITGVPRWPTGAVTFTGEDGFNYPASIDIYAVDQNNGYWTGFFPDYGVDVTGEFSGQYNTTGTVHLLNQGFIRNSGILTSGGLNGRFIIAYDYTFNPGVPFFIKSDDVFFATGYINFTGSGLFNKTIAGPTGLIHVDTFVTGTGVTGLFSSTGLYSFSSGLLFSSSNPIYSSGIITGSPFGPPPNVFREINVGYSGIEFYSINNRGRRLFPRVFNTPISGNFEGTFIGSGFMTQSKTSIATGIFYLASGIISDRSFRTGYKDFNITGFFTTISGHIDWTGNINTGFGYIPYYTGTTLLQNIRGRSYEATVFRTGFVNFAPETRFFTTSVESQRFFIATGFINFRSGITFTESDKGKELINGILLTGTGSVILPPNVFPISTPNFSGVYDFTSTGTGFMTVTGFRQITFSNLLTGVTGIWETTGFSNVIGRQLFINTDLGTKSFALNYTGQAVTGTLLPIKSVYPDLFEIRSGFDHITTNQIQTVRGSGLMTGFLQTTQGLNDRSGISGTLEFLGNITGFATGIVTGASGIVPISITGGIFSSYISIPYNVSNPHTGIFNFNATFTRTGIFDATGLALTTGSYRSKTNFLITGLATGFFFITGTGFVDLTGSVILNRNQTLFTNYPYPSGNSIAFITLTGLNNFTGDFRSGIRITGLYNKNFTGIFTGSISGSYTGMWSGTGTFTGSSGILYNPSDLGAKTITLNQSLSNTGLESGLVPIFTIGLYSGLRTIQNITINESRLVTGSGFFVSIASGFGLAGTTSGSGIGLVTGYLSGLINKNYLAGTNFEPSLTLTGFLSGNRGVVLTGIFTGTINLTGRISRSFSLRSSGIATGFYLSNKTFTGGFELYTGVSITGSFIKISPNSQTGWVFTTDVKTGQIFYVQINSRNILDEVSGYFNARVFSGGLAGSVDNNIIYASRLF